LNVPRPKPTSDRWAMIVLAARKNRRKKAARPEYLII
jgi:hypothetical protein